MKIKFINDWRYLSFKKDPHGARMLNFTIILISYMHTGIKEVDIDGFSIVLLGIGIKISRL
jgi:hypothetical protein